jgi:hypothetical protein
MDFTLSSDRGFDFLQEGHGIIQRACNIQLHYGHPQDLATMLGLRGSGKYYPN